MLFVDIARSTGPVRFELDHMGFLQANELVALVLGRKVQREKSGSHCFFEGERIGRIRCSIVKRE